MIQFLFVAFKKYAVFHFWEWRVLFGGHFFSPLKYSMSNFRCWRPTKRFTHYCNKQRVNGLLISEKKYLCFSVFEDCV